MKIEEIEIFNNSNIIRLAEILEKKEALLFQIRNKLLHVAKAGKESYSVNIFNADDLGAFEDINKIDFDYVINAGIVYSKSTIEAIVLAMNNY